MNKENDPTTPEYWKHKADSQSNEQLKEIYLDTYEKMRNGDFSDDSLSEEMTDEELKTKLDEAVEMLTKPAPINYKQSLLKKERKRSIFSNRTEGILKLFAYLILILMASIFIIPYVYEIINNT